MEIKYSYNADTGTLHIVGLCKNGERTTENFKYFDTEEEAYSYAGRNIKPCKICEKKKIKMLEDAIK